MSAWVLVAIAVFYAATSVVLLRSHLRTKATSRRIESYLAEPVVVDEDVETDIQRDGDDSERPLTRARVWLAEALELADIDVPAEVFARNVGLATLGAGLLIGVVVGVPAAIVVFAGVPLAAWSVISNRQRRRRRRFADQLAETVQAIAGSMRAGHGMSSSIAMVADDAPEPMAGELQRVVAAERLGVPLDDALAVAVQRTGSRDLQNLGLVAGLQREIGGNGAEALDRIVETVRQRDDLRRLVTTLTAQGTMSRWIMTMLPIVLAALLAVINPGFLSPLWNESAGRVMAIGAIALIVAGSYWIKRIVEIEV